MRSEGLNRKDEGGEEIKMYYRKKANEEKDERKAKRAYSGNWQK